MKLHQGEIDDFGQINVCTPDENNNDNNGVEYFLRTRVCIESILLLPFGRVGCTSSQIIFWSSTAYSYGL